MDSRSRDALKALAVAFALVAGLSACGGGGGDNVSPAVDTPAPAPAPTPTPSAPAVSATDPDPDEAEPAGSNMELTAVRAPDALQPSTAAVTLAATGAALSTSLADYTVYLNDQLLDASALSVSAGQLVMTAALAEGRNDIQVFAPDATGAPVEASMTVWAGTQKVAGRVVDQGGNPVAGATVVAALGDDSTVTATTTTDAAGNYTLSNFPGRTVLVAVTGPTGLPGAAASIAGTPFADVVLLAFGTPVAAPNNDFSSGTNGWLNTNGASLTLIAHAESPGPTGGATAAVQKAAKVKAQADSPTDQDLKIATSGEGPRTVTYTFTPPADAKTARLKYRFQTDEFPTYFGTQYNDSFSVILRTQGGKKATIAGAMNELGQAAFDSSGSTAWKELTVELATPGEPVEVDVTVANVGDGVVDSSVIVDLVTTSPLAIPSAALFDIDNSKLTMLSASEHTYFGGNTRVNATFTVTGPETATLSKLELQVSQAGVLKATGKLTSALESTVYKKLSASGVTIATATLAFEIPGSELGTVNASTDGALSLKLVATADDGSTAEKDMGSVQLLDQWKGTDRYGGRDEALGGDDWTTAVLRDVCDAVDLKWGDFSNMNGGKFAPHSSHKDGHDVDGWYDGYNARDAAAATKMIELLNTTGVGNKVKIVYVTHTAAPGNAFYDTYKDVTLADGRAAKSVIRNYPDHATHFHWNVH